MWRSTRRQVVAVFPPERSERIGLVEEVEAAAGGGVRTPASVAW